MKIKSIQLKNIRSYTDETIEFPAGATLLSGDIGCGKSTILLAMEFALFGLKKGEISGSDVLRHGKDSGLVRLNFELDGNDITIERTLRRSKNIEQDFGSIVINGNFYEFTPLELKSRILEMFGYSQEMLKKNIPLFRFTIYTPQEEMKSILLSSEDRLRILRSIFGIDKYGTIRNNARLFMTELRSMKREEESFLRTLDFDLSQLEAFVNEKKSVTEKIADEKISLASAEKDFISKKNELEAVKKNFEHVNAARLDLAKKQTEAITKRDRAKNLVRDIAEMDEKISNYRDSIHGIEPFDTNELKQKLHENEIKRDSIIYEKAILEAEIKKLQSIYSKGVCEMCGQVVHNPEEFKMHIENHAARLGNISSELEEFEASISGIKNSVSMAEKFYHTKRIMEDLSNLSRDLTNQKEIIDNEIKILEKKTEELLPQLAEYENLRSAISRMEGEYYALYDRRSEIEKNIARCEQNLQNIEKRIDEMNKKLAEKESIRKKIARINELLAWFEPFIGLTENIERHVMFAIQQQFDSYFQKWFSILMNDALAVRVDDRFSPVIEQNGFETDYNNLSGGEKTSVALAYRLALNKVINEMIESIKTKDLLILDEPTDGFSTDQLDRIRDVINELNLKQIIIVSHEPKIDTYVDNVIKIHKENHVSRVAY